MSDLFGLGGSWWLACARASGGRTSSMGVKAWWRQHFARPDPGSGRAAWHRVPWGVRAGVRASAGVRRRGGRQHAGARARARHQGGEAARHRGQHGQHARPARPGTQHSSINQRTDSSTNTRDFAGGAPGPRGPGCAVAGVRARAGRSQTLVTTRAPQIHRAVCAGASHCTSLAGAPPAGWRPPRAALEAGGEASSSWQPAADRPRARLQASQEQRGARPWRGGG